MFGDSVAPFPKIVGYESKSSEIRMREAGNVYQILHAERVRGFIECVEDVCCR